jgi:hypothetical protein
MDYGLLRTYGLWYAIPCERSWWTAWAMGFKGLWVIRGMGYERSDCIYIGTLTASTEPTSFDTIYAFDMLYHLVQCSLPI